MSTSTTIGLGRLQKCFAVQEATPGTIEIPVSSDLIVVNSGELQIPNPNFVEDKGMRGSRSEFRRYNTTTGGGALKISRYVRPSGSLGVAPEGGCLWESGMGLESITGGASVTYANQDTHPSFTFYARKDHTVYVASGCCTDKLSAKKNQKDILELSDDCKCMKVIWTGTGALAEAITTAPAAGTEEWWSVDDVKKWCVGSHILIGSEQMQVTGTYWEGTSGGSAGKIKLKRGHNSSTPATHLNAAAITPWLPTGTETGAALSARLGTVTIAGATVPLLDIDWNHENGMTLTEEEMSGSAYPSDFVEGQRKVNGTMNLYFRKADAKYFADAQLQTRKAVVINFGSTAGSRMAINLPYCEMDMPALSGDKDAFKIAVKYQAFANAGNDEDLVVFT